MFSLITKILPSFKIWINSRLLYFTFSHIHQLPRLRNSAFLNTIMMFKTSLTMFMILCVIMSSTRAGPLSYAVCQTGCNAVWVACVSAGGGVAGVSTGGAGVPAAILACNATNGVCMAMCAALLLAPSP